MVLNIMYSVFSAALALWNIAILSTILGVWPQLIWSRLCFTFGVVMATALFYFASAFPHQSLKRGWINLLVGVSALFLSVLTLTKWMVARVEVVDGYITGDLGFVVPIFTLSVLLLSAASLIILVYKYFKSAGIVRSQLLYILIGFTFFQISFQTTNLVLPIFFGIFQFNNLGPVFSLPMVALIGYAMVRHRFLDVRIVIQRSLLYFVAVSLVVAIYTVLIFAFEALFLRPVGNAPLISAAAAAIAVVAGFPYLKERFQKATDKFFFRQSYNYPEVLKELSRTLNSILDIDRLARSASEVLKQSLKVKEIYVALADDNGSFFFVGDAPPDGRLILERAGDISKFLMGEKKSVVYEELEYEIKNSRDAGRGIRLDAARNVLRETGVYLALPIFSQEKLIGIFLFGKKLSGEPFFKRDIELLETFSHQAGIALENAKLYEVVKEYKDDLEKKVEDRTDELKRLYGAQSRFMADISHELQTPLAIAKGNLSLVSASISKKDSRSAKIIDIVNQAINGASRLIHNLLILARADFRHQELNKATVDLSGLIKDIHEESYILAKDKKIKFSVAAEEGVIIFGDMEKLRELFLNSISNAIKYTPPGGNIAAKLTRDRGGARIEVADSGLGIAEKDLPHLFERFYRIKENNETGAAGTGLGLAICKLIAEAHGGGISVESRLGRGSKFIVTLPLPENFSKN